VKRGDKARRHIVGAKLLHDVAIVGQAVVNEAHDSAHAAGARARDVVGDQDA
jgi:predicted N-acetyltransferase YhbS